jgi:hypothetical protein
LIFDCSFSMTSLFFSSLSHIYIHIATHLSTLIPLFSFYNTNTYSFSFIIFLNQKKNDLKNKKNRCNYNP